jgi:hypothetical protein
MAGKMARTNRFFLACYWTESRWVPRSIGCSIFEEFLIYEKGSGFSCAPEITRLISRSKRATPVARKVAYEEAKENYRRQAAPSAPTFQRDEITR